MSVIPLLILVSLAIALIFLGGFIWAVRAGQYEDTYTPSLRVLLEDPRRPAAGAAGARTEGDASHDSVSVAKPPREPSAKGSRTTNA